MPDITLSQALQEAYASAPSSTPIVDTLSFWFNGLTAANGVATEIYTYSGYHSAYTGTDGVPRQSFTLEAGSRYNAGLAVDFISLPFQVTPPNVTSDSVTKGKLILDGVGRDVSDLMLQAVAAAASIEVTYRAYLYGLESLGPQNLPPIVFALTNVSATSTQVRGDIGMPNLGNKRFPSQIYRSSVFTALR